ncbi:hypothetical protein ACKVEX_12215 [Rhodocyclaceae bacterium SMB388]
MPKTQFDTLRAIGHGAAQNTVEMQCRTGLVVLFGPESRQFSPTLVVAPANADFVAAADAVEREGATLANTIDTTLSKWNMHRSKYYWQL